MLGLHDSEDPAVIQCFLQALFSMSHDLHPPQSACPNCGHMASQQTQEVDHVLSSSFIANTDFVPPGFFGSTVTGYSYLKDFRYLSRQFQTREMTLIGGQISWDVLSREQ